MASLQGYWLKPWSVFGINTTGVQWWKTPVLTPNNGVRAYTALTYYYEYDDVASCRGEIARFTTLMKGNEEGPWMGVAEGPGVIDVTFQIKATNAFATFFLIVDIFQ